MQTFKECLKEKKLEENNILESFEINNNYKILSKTQASKYWLKILTPRKEEEEETLQELYHSLHWLKCYITKNEDREYFIYSFYNKGVYEIHFYDMNNVQEDNELKNLNLTKNSQHVFSCIVSIVLDEILNNSLQKIKIGAPKNKESIYFKMIQKVLKKYNLDKLVKIIDTPTGKDYLIECEFIKMTPMNIMELKICENKETIDRISILIKLRNKG